MRAVAEIHHSKPEVVEHYGRQRVVIADGVEIGKYDNPLFTPPTSLATSTLQSVVDYVASNIPDGDVGDAGLIIVQVHGPAHVSIIAPVVGDHRQQFTYLTAKAVRPEYRFGQFLDLETFIVMLMSQFLPNGDQQAMLQLLGRVKVEQSVEATDDGIGQTVTAKVGVTRSEKVAIQNPWMLAPFRTFPEINQPESPFILRMNKEGSCALFEGDGGAWRIRAISAIGAWLRDKLPDTIILA